jgi:hypothetical protein
VWLGLPYSFQHSQDPFLIADLGDPNRE